ncbi:Poly(A) RNA polymerase protein cid1 [Podospora conica]|nr:Poly(A) RNA polymerase protein cid1 [Schizothecium conicum]
MSAQLSIPVDPRPQQPQSARAYASPPAYPHHQYSHSQQLNQSRGQGQRPHSATFRPSSQGTGSSNAPPQGPPFPSHARHQSSLSYHGSTSSQQNWQQPQGPGGSQRSYQSPPFDPTSPRNPRHSSQGSVGGSRLYHVREEDLKAQCELLDLLCQNVIAGAEIEHADIVEKESFRCMIEDVARRAIYRHEVETNGIHNFNPESVQLKCFGSLSSGFATKAADMDLGLFSPQSLIQPDAPGSPIPRLVEKAFLDIGLGARLLTRTRVPIIKVCANPPPVLKADLLEERAKWERGTAADEDDEDDAPEEPDSPGVAEMLGAQDHQDEKDAAPHKAGPKQPQGKLRSLRQGKRALTSYINNARTLFRKLGARDLVQSTSSHLKESDLHFLNEFGLAFVDGLSDSALQTRLLSYKSLDRHTLLTTPNYRNFLGVCAQVEGEAMVMACEARKIKERASVHEKQIENVTNTWKLICDRPSFGLDPAGYTKDLQLAADQLKTFPSIQLMVFCQNQYESASAYHTRALKLLMDLGGHDAPSSILDEFIQSYIRGITSESHRQGVEEFVASNPLETLTLRLVARKHKALELAYGLERALAKRLYSEADSYWVQLYIDKLRASVGKLDPDGQPGSFVAPLSPSEREQILSHIRQIGSPFKLAPNQPRDPFRDRLEFPKSGVGVQCDINFSAHLGLQNTLLLRCYSHCDPRVRPLVLFVKHWAKVRRINSPYRGTLSSYGYVLMMLHYLINVAKPFVCPNLQELARPADPNLTPAQLAETVACKGHNIQFWRDEAEIQRLARDNALNQNRDSLGHLLRGFFEYYAQTNQMSTNPCRGFDWGRDVLSIRTHGGLLSKQDKGWTGAKTIVEVRDTAAVPPPPGTSPDPVAALDSPAHPPAGREVKEVRLRYLFAIEDPFELDHNVARTVTHNGIVAIRDEFRRAWRIIKGAGHGGHGGEDLLQDEGLREEQQEREQFERLLAELHG